MVLQKLWVSQNFSRITYTESRSLVFLGVMCVSQSRFLYGSVSESWFFFNFTQATFIFWKNRQSQHLLIVWTPEKS